MDQAARLRYSLSLEALHKSKQWYHNVKRNENIDLCEKWSSSLFAFYEAANAQVTLWSIAKES